LRRKERRSEQERKKQERGIVKKKTQWKWERNKERNAHEFGKRCGI
jgi:hypothetical protein